MSSAMDRVQDVYIAYYGRPGDPAGLNFWANQLVQQGGNIASIINPFGMSEEFNVRFGGLSNEVLVNNIFQQVFNRDADELGLNFYTNLLENGELTLSEIAITVLGGAQGIDEQTLLHKKFISNVFSTLVDQGAIDYDSIVDANNAREFLAQVDATIESVKEALIALGLNPDDYLDDQGEVPD
ncbi:DUF4214 domain-containing protein, partial [Bisbaumannia pacifica]